MSGTPPPHASSSTAFVAATSLPFPSAMGGRERGAAQFGLQEIGRRQKQLGLRLSRAERDKGGVAVERGRWGTQTIAAYIKKERGWVPHRTSNYKRDGSKELTKPSDRPRTFHSIRNSF
ncbi:hypothetical protein B296_00022454 [Ensete ventricosum]|uniref:Uncharacterized protein n=1 Tax=Ensete ventricosum TaxID=4639 RepID=A0A426ZEK7_ENSVE|nr:hypothetical protein B296_00022454 [Ensete ventricosum]